LVEIAACLAKQQAPHQGTRAYPWSLSSNIAPFLDFIPIGFDLQYASATPPAKRL
jgi:hypothetical protein